MPKSPKPTIVFHNPNSQEKMAEILVKISAEVASSTVQATILHINSIDTSTNDQVA